MHFLRLLPPPPPPSFLVAIRAPAFSYRNFFNSTSSLSGNGGTWKHHTTSLSFHPYSQVVGVYERVVTTKEELQKFYDECLQNRSTTSTKMNDRWVTSRFPLCCDWVMPTGSHCKRYVLCLLSYVSVFWSAPQCERSSFTSTCYCWQRVPGAEALNLHFHTAL